MARHLEAAALRADHPRHQPEVGGKPVVESVDDVPEEPAGAGPVPGLGLRAAHPSQRLRVLLRLLRQPERRGSHRTFRGLAIEAEIPFDLASLLLEQHGKQEPRAEPARQPRAEPRPARGRRRLHLVPVFRQQLPPHLHVTVLHGSELPVEVRLVRVPLGLGELAIQEGGIGLVFEVVEPHGGGGGRRHVRIYSAGLTAFATLPAPSASLGSPCMGPG